tara:strand:+ start:532 stop:996 length:465 start_codon:yes stop_codon:yes gene_type:complete
MNVSPLSSSTINKPLENDTNTNTETSLVTTNNQDTELLEKGQSILNNHEFFNDLSELMEDAKFNAFFEKYFTDMNEIKVTLTYMKLYKEFKNKWRTLTDTELDKRINIYLMWKMMKNPTTNRLALHTVLKHFENPKSNNIFNDIQEFMSITDGT